ncbi:putative uncharacterized protein DDB_G0282133 isoform X2 [Manduca sexta]|uniref:putative uncharacterized protein DDB_G0282133 isoform X2 n=1 Tax=Manduca sexta TaxID=7130 RepID=UPI00188F854B|nr:putative uncharacterized protein DDB_G0282133 isoform X2 [Manduca sexta]
MKMTGSRAYTRPTPVPKMPPGLVELMEGMTKEVLRCNTTNVYEFCAAHMQKLLEIRDGPTGKRTLNLEQKISKAQAIIKQRAQDRQRKYDKEMQLLSKIDDKDNKLPPQSTLIKAPVTHELFSNRLDEIEISHNSLANPFNCEENNEIIKSEELFPVTKEATISVDQNVNQTINELESNSTAIDIKKIESNLDKSFDVLPATLTNASECINISGSHDSSKVFKIPGLSKNVEEKNNNNMAVNEAEVEYIPPAVETPEKNEIRENNVGIPPITQNIKSYSSQYSIDNKEIKLDENKSNIKDIKIKEETENNISVISEVDLFDDKISKIPANRQSVPEDNLTNGMITVEATYNLTKNDNISTSMSKNNENDFGTSINYADDNIKSHVTENHKVEIDNNLTGVTDVASSTFDIATNLNQKNSELQFLNKGNVKRTEQDDENHGESEIDEYNKHSYLSSNSIHPATDISPENPTGIVSSDDRGTNNMDLETAAITIQKVFRSFLFKSRASNDDTSSIDEDNKEANGYSSSNSTKERRSLGITRMDTMLQTVNEEKSLSLSTDDSSTLSSAATIIQAHIRGFLVRNKLNSNKTTSTNSILNSDDPVTSSPDNETNQNQNNNRTVLNIHIVPEGNMPSLSHDESIVTSMDMSLDGSPLSSINLHPLGYDKSEPRKQLKREDAIQSISPPSNNSGKLSEDVDSTKEVLISGAITNDNNLASDNDHTDKTTIVPDVSVIQDDPVESLEVSVPDSTTNITRKKNSLTKMSSDEMDVVTPFTSDNSQHLPESSNITKLMHSGELHDVVLPTNVSRSSTSVVRGE